MPLISGHGTSFGDSQSEVPPPSPQPASGSRAPGPALPSGSAGWAPMSVAPVVPQEGDQRWVNTVAQALHLLSTLYGPFPNCYGIGRCAKVSAGRARVPAHRTAGRPGHLRQEACSSLCFYCCGANPQRRTGAANRKPRARAPGASVSGGGDGGERGGWNTWGQNR